MLDQAEERSLVLKATQLLALYVVYVFLSGWTALDYYYRYFGIDPKTLTLGIPETLVHGFTILFTGGGCLWPIYILLLIVPLVLEEKVKNRLGLSISLVVILVGLLLAVYFISRSAGQEGARRDKSDKSRLPSMTFNVRGRPYYGRLLILRDGKYFVHGVAPTGQSAAGNLELSIYRAEELTEVRITEYQ